MTVLDSRTQPAKAEARPAAGANGQAAPATMTRDPEARLQALFDPGTVRLLTPHDDSGALAACGQIGGMPAVSFVSDPRVQGGAMGTAGCAAIVAAYDEAIAQGAPVIGLWHSGGARLREGVESLHAVIAANTVPTACRLSTPSRSRAPPECHRPITGAPRAMASS